MRASVQRVESVKRLGRCRFDKRLCTYAYVCRMYVKSNESLYSDASARAHTFVSPSANFFRLINFAIVLFQASRDSLSPFFFFGILATMPNLSFVLHTSNPNTTNQNEKSVLGRKKRLYLDEKRTTLRLYVSFSHSLSIYYNSARWEQTHCQATRTVSKTENIRPIVRLVRYAPKVSEKAAATAAEAGCSSNLLFHYSFLII